MSIPANGAPPDPVSVDGNGLHHDDAGYGRNVRRQPTQHVILPEIGGW